MTARNGRPQGSDRVPAHHGVSADGDLSIECGANAAANDEVGSRRGFAKEQRSAVMSRDQ